jgi:thiol-disulfide isomerase/thioredoxin
MARRGITTLVALLLLTCISSAPSRGQERTDATGKFESLETLNAYYQRHATELDRRRIADLEFLSKKLSGSDADAAYRVLFNLAIARELFREADPAARRYRERKGSPTDLRALASFVTIVAQSQRGEHRQSLEELKSFLEDHAGQSLARLPADRDPILTVGEAYLQRLILAGRYDVARQVCDLVREGNASPAVKDHFAARMNRLNLLGKLAPNFGGQDVDGLPIRLANYRNQALLVEFWATWCPPCIAAMPSLNALQEKYRKQGFNVLGVNVDTEHENVRDPKSVLPAVRRFMVENRVIWPTLLNGDGESDFAKLYGVDHIPANFLIGRDGKIIGFELSGQALEKAVVKALAQDIPRSGE